MVKAVQQNIMIHSVKRRTEKYRELFLICVYAEVIHNFDQSHLCTVLGSETVLDLF